MRRKWSGFVFVCLVLTVLSPLAVLPARAAGPSITLTFDHEDWSGKTGTIDIIATSSTGDAFDVSASDITICFDKDILTFSACEAGSIPYEEPDADSANAKGSFTLSCAEGDIASVASGSVAATCGFSVKDHAGKCDSRLTWDADALEISCQPQTGSAETYGVTGAETWLHVPGDPPRLQETFTFDYGPGGTSVVVNGSKDAENPAIAIPALKAGQDGRDVILSDLDWSAAAAEGGTGSADDIDFDVDVDAGTVKIVVDKNAVAGEYTITGEDRRGALGIEPMYSGTAAGTLVVTRGAPEAAAIEVYRRAVGSGTGTRIDGNTDSIAVPRGGNVNSVVYSAVVKDQFGAEMPDDGEIEITGAGHTGINIHQNGFQISVDSTAAAGGSYTLTVTSRTNAALRAAVTISTVDVTFTDVDYSVKADPTYGDPWGRIITNISGQARVGGETIPGTFTLKGAGDTPDAGAAAVELVFNAAAADSPYRNIPVPAENLPAGKAAVDIARRSLANATIGAISEQTYDGTEKRPEPTVTDDLHNALTRGIDFDYSYAGNTAAGTNTARVIVTGRGNYTGTKEAAFTIRPAEAVLKEPAAVPAIYANSTDNNDEDALRAYVQSKNPTIQSGDGRVTFTAAWSRKAGTPAYQRTGGTYTYAAVLTNPQSAPDATGSCDLPAAPEVTVEVKPVTATPAAFAETGKTVAASVVTADGFTMAALGLPAQTGTVAYTPAEAGAGTPASFTVSGWTSGQAPVTVDTLRAAASRVAGGASADIVMTPVYSDVPAWATPGTAPAYTLRITSKCPVNVRVTPPASITYGAALEDPGAEQEAIGGGTDTSGQAAFAYRYVGVDGTSYDSADKPAAAGRYQVVATLVSDTHSGSGTSAAFAINPVQLTAENTAVTGVSASYPYTGSAIEPRVNVAVADIGMLAEAADYTLAYTADRTNAGEKTITITGAGNYSGSVTRTFEISRAALTGMVSVKVKADNGIAGTIDKEDVLTADVSMLSETDVAGGRLAFQWYRGADAIAGADGQDYTLGDGDASGSVISVKVTAAGTSNYTGTVASSSVTVDKKAMPALALKIVSADGADGIELTAVVTVGDTSGTELRDHFRVQWYCDGEAGGAPVEISAGDGAGGYTAAYHGSAPEAGRTYTCAIVPADPGGDYTGTVPAAGTSNTSSKTETAAVGTIQVKAAAPARPVVDASAGETSINLTWPRPNDGGSPITGYTVSYSTGGGPAATVNLEAGAVGFGITGLREDTEYTITVTAINAKGSAVSDAITRRTGKTRVPVTPVDPTPSRPGSGGGSNGSGGGSGDRDAPISVRSSGGDHGSVRLSTSDAKAGDTVTITVKPDRGYEVDRVLVRTSSGGTVDVRSIGGGEYAFTMPGGTVRVEVVYRGADTAARPGFADVPDTYWAADAIRWVNENGWIMGGGAGTFNPEGRITRQQMWMIIAHMAGANPNGFDEARVWAIASGISDGTVPGGFVTRQQMVTILYRYARMMGLAASGGMELSAFPDSGSVASYAREALRWSVGSGIVRGTADGRLNPGGIATRAQFAAVLHRFYTSAAR